MVLLAAEAYYTAIRDAIAGNDLPLVIENVRAGRKAHPTDAEFAKIEAIALVKLEKHAQALAVIEGARKAKVISEADMAFEYAYCQFSIGNYDRAKEALAKAPAGSAVDRLAAQIAYKSNRFADCIEIYKKLLASVEDSSTEHSELTLNLAAARAAAAQHAEQASCQSSGPLDSYELMFNRATELLACERVKDAADLLEAAESRAKTELTSEDWSFEDIQNEVAPIEAQRAVALQKLGNYKCASAIYASLLSNPQLDRATRIVVSHNAAVLRAHNNKSDFALASQLKRTILLPRDQGNELSRLQQVLIKYNMAAVQALQHQYVAAGRKLNRIFKMHRECATVNAGLTSAVVSLKMGNASDALNRLFAMVRAQDAVSGVYLALAAAQIALALGSQKRASDVLSIWRHKARDVSLAAVANAEEFVRYYYGICRLIDWIEPQLSAADAAMEVHSKVYEQEKPSAHLLAAAGDCLVYAGDIKQAHKCFKDACASAATGDSLSSVFMAAVLAPDAIDVQSTAQLLKEYSNRKQAARRILGISPRIARKFQPRGSGVGADKPGKPSRKLAVQAEQCRKRNQIRRQRKLAKAPPKSYEPGRVPDSERWLPLRQRSYYRPRGRAQRQQHRMRSGAQGGATEAGSGLGGTGSARIAGKDGSPAASTSANANSLNQDANPGASKAKPKHKGKSKSKELLDMEVLIKTAAINQYKL
ncbi:Srp72p [Coemansia sp. RSA 2336]|nr:Srp72p [Coemansia sp. RSA 2336]